MKISKKLRITGLVVKPSNIRELARKVYEEYEGDNESDHKRINFILEGVDGTQYESGDVKIFSDNGILDTRRIIGIEMTYSNYTSYKGISIKLRHTVTDYKWENLISVSGPDEVWVNGIIKSFEDIISNWEKQVNWPHKYYWPLTIIFAIGISLLCFNILNFILYSIELESLLLFFSLGIWPALYIVNKLKKLYPIVELRTGPEHTQVEVKKRRKLYAIITMGATPFVISLIIELIKRIIR